MAATRVHVPNDGAQSSEGEGLSPSAVKLQTIREQEDAESAGRMSPSRLWAANLAASASSRHVRIAGDAAGSEGRNRPNHRQGSSKSLDITRVVHTDFEPEVPRPEASLDEHIRLARTSSTRDGLKKLRHTISKRVKGHVKVHKLNEVGEIVDKKGHRAWDMACALQLGIRINVGMNSQASFSKVPDFETFQENIKLKFPSKGSSITPSHSGPSFKFKDYAPTIFRHLRDAFSIDTADYMVAICNTVDDGSNNLRIMGTPGKSGSLFFFSNDMRFIIKTLPKREARLLREILPAYYQHVKQYPV